MKISFGMITKDLLSMEPLDQFLENARKFGHPIDSVVIGYADQLDRNVVKALEKKVTVHLVKIRKSQALHKKLRSLGMAEAEIKTLIGDVLHPFDGRAAYGMSRNHVIIKAILEALDVLIFIDTDVYPEVVINAKDMDNDPRLYLKNTGLKDIYIQEVDFVGRHMETLVRSDVMVTTSDYTGYYIIPPMRFEGMEALFYGLKKETAYNYIMESYHHRCLSTDHGLRRQAFRTHKVLGGNAAIKLKLFKEIVPFFSGVYTVDDHKYLTRGEDTVLALQMKGRDDQKFIDVDMKIFHNTYGHFPSVPDILKEKHIKDRFFYACMGWIGRNPFLNALSGIPTDCAYGLEHQHLKDGAKAAAEYLDDDRFLLLPKAHDIAYGSLPQMQEEFERFKYSWFDFIRRLK